MKQNSSLFVKQTLLLCVGLMLCLSASARRLIGNVTDSGGKDLPGAVVELLSATDSSVIRSTVTKEIEAWGWKHYQFSIDVDNNTTYILRASMIGFKTQYRKVDVKMAERVAEQWVEPFQLEEDSKTLSEVVVKATKIKMVMHGDTVVYNADAFNLSEGSMLDALIRQLPGATLENGVIKVNGRTVSSLLVDGRNFFSGDAKKALENLPAYTVDKVKVYDKAGRESRFMQRDMGDKELVLDVNLKKQYKQGFIGNVDLAAGTSDRYTGRLFGMLYNKHSRLTLTGNTNNVNDGSVPGENSAMGEMPSAGGGRTSMRDFGLNYRIEGKSEDNSFETSNNYTSSDAESVTRTNSQTFLTGGDTYNLSSNTSRAKNYTWTTNNGFSWTEGRTMLMGSLGVSHTHNEGWGNSLSASFNQKPSGMAAIDSIYSPNADRNFLRMIINRVRNVNQYQGQSRNYTGTYRQLIRIGGMESKPWESDNMSVSANGNYTSSNNDRFTLNNIDYLATGTYDNRNQFSPTTSKNYSYNMELSYSHFLKRDSTGLRTFFIRPSVNYSQDYSSQNYALYRLDKLADYDSTAYAIGVLPSTREALLGVKDNSNSYWSRETTRDSKANVMLNYNIGDGIQRPRLQATATIEADWRYEKLNYFREKSYNKSRHKLLLRPTANFSYQFNDSTGFVNTGISYSSSESLPDLSSQLDIRDDANPLNVTVGNPNLKNARTHTVSLQWSKMKIYTQQDMSFRLNYTITQNAIATAMLYDKQTGVTTTQQQNVNGNWSLGLSHGMSRPVDKKQRLTLSNRINVNYNNSVDLTTVEGTPNTRSDVHNWNADWNPEAEYQIGDRLRLSFTPSLSYQRATSDRADFTKVSAWNYNFGFSGNAKLPWHFEISTDITNYNRSGYNDEQMNTSEWIWNARLTRSFMHSRLTFSLDAFDILGQLKNTTFTLNSQGRTEQWNNGLPRYAMLHVAYKFNSMKRNDSSDAPL